MCGNCFGTKSGRSDVKPPRVSRLQLPHQFADDDDWTSCITAEVLAWELLFVPDAVAIRKHREKRSPTHRELYHGHPSPRTCAELKRDADISAVEECSPCHPNRSS